MKYSEWQSGVHSKPGDWQGIEICPACNAECHVFDKCCPKCAYHDPNMLYAWKKMAAKRAIITKKARWFWEKDEWYWEYKY
jgi:hypothetical protein